MNTAPSYSKCFDSRLPRIYKALHRCLSTKLGKPLRFFKVPCPQLPRIGMVEQVPWKDWKKYAKVMLTLWNINKSTFFIYNTIISPNKLGAYWPPPDSAPRPCAWKIRKILPVHVENDNSTNLMMWIHLKTLIWNTVDIRGLRNHQRYQVTNFGEKAAVRFSFFLWQKLSCSDKMPSKKSGHLVATWICLMKKLGSSKDVPCFGTSRSCGRNAWLVRKRFLGYATIFRTEMQVAIFHRFHSIVNMQHP